jgi:hypothetical protein
MSSAGILSLYFFKDTTNLTGFHVSRIGSVKNGITPCQAMHHLPEIHERPQKRSTIQPLKHPYTDILFYNQGIFQTHIKKPRSKSPSGDRFCQTLFLSGHLGDFPH